MRNVYGEERETHKAWISVATCASSRAVHLDLTANYSSEECIEVLRRFIARHSVPDLIRSDNGSNFTSEDVQNFASSRNIEWKFNIEGAP